MKIYDWNKISLGKSKKAELSAQKPVFIIGSREVSPKRIQQLAQLSKQKHVVWGILKNEYIDGFEGSPQFKTLSESVLTPLIKGVGGFETGNITIIKYFQQDWVNILKEIKFSMVLLVNGSWNRSIHLQSEFWEIMEQKIPYKFISPFISEEEAKEYLKEVKPELDKIAMYDSNKSYSDKELMNLANQEAKKSFDWTYQVGAVVAKEGKVLATSHNMILPYESYTLHFGSLREKTFTPMGDTSKYDTNHAETELVLKALNDKIDLTGATLYINVLPCPTCAKMLSRTNISEIVYSLDHSDGYAVKLLEEMGKRVRRIVL